MRTLRALGWSMVAVLAIALLPSPLPGPAGTAEANHRVALVGGNCAANGQEVEVGIIDFDFVPRDLSVTMGTVVTWTNDGPNEPHTATEHHDLLDPALWDSGVLQVGQHFSAKMCLRGFFNYRCDLHGFTGTVTVLPPT